MEILVVVKRTAHRLFGGRPHVKKLVAAKDVTVSRLRRSHDDHEATVREVHAAVKTLRAQATFVETLSLDPPHKGRCDLVVTVGGDGTLLNASHVIGAGIPVLGVNSAPADSVGFFCGAEKGRVLEALRAAFSGSLPRVELSRMRVERNGTLLHDRVLNEVLFCHELPAGTSRYIVRVTNRKRGEGRATTASEEQKSSGVWVGPAAGSTAAQRSAGGRVLPLTSRRLQFVVREAYVPRGEKLRLLQGVIDDGGVIELLSKMEEGRVFIDGVHIVANLGWGDRLRLSRSPEPLLVLGLRHGR